MNDGNINRIIAEAEERGRQRGLEEAATGRQAMTETKPSRGGTGMREALIAYFEKPGNTTAEQTADDICTLVAALSSTGDERREAIEECAKVAGSVVIFDGGLLKSKGDMRAIAEMTSKVIAASIRSLARRWRGGMSENLDYEAWRCGKYGGFCPDEGCSKKDGCARDHGWIPAHPIQRTAADEERAKTLLRAAPDGKGKGDE